MKKNIFIVFVILICTSCDSHQFYFDVENQTIVSCNSSRLRHLDFTNDSLQTHFRLEWEGEVEDAPKNIEIENLQDGYIINRGLEKKRKAKDSLLEKSATYEVKSSGGDAGPYRITITTDENGKVVRTSHGSCD